MRRRSAAKPTATSARCMRAGSTRPAWSRVGRSSVRRSCSPAAGSTRHCVNGGGDLQAVGEATPGVGLAGRHRASVASRLLRQCRHDPRRRGSDVGNRRARGPRHRPVHRKAGHLTRERDCRRCRADPHRRLCHGRARHGSQGQGLAGAASRLRGLRRRCRRHRLVDVGLPEGRHRLLSRRRVCAPARRPRRAADWASYRRREDQCRTTRCRRRRMRAGT